MIKRGKYFKFEKINSCQDIISYRYYHPWCLIDFVWKFYPQRKEMDELIDSLTQMFAKVSEHAINLSAKYFLNFRYKPLLLFLV